MRKEKSSVLASCAIVVSPLGSILGDDIVDVKDYLRGLEDPMREPLEVLGVVDYRALVEHVLFGSETTTQDDEYDEHLSKSELALSLPLPPSAPLSAPLLPPLVPLPPLRPSPSSDSLLPPADSLLPPLTSEKDVLEFNAQNDGVSDAEGTVDTRRRKVSLSSLVVTSPARARTEYRPSWSTTGPRRRLRRSVFEVFKFKSEGAGD